MPLTHVFSGISESRKTIHGRINVKGNNNTAIISFENKRGPTSNASLTIYNLDQLTQQALFQTSHEMPKQELMMSTWFIRRSANLIIKYAAGSDTALVFISENDVIEEFNKLSDHPLFVRLDYFNELSFCKKLADKTGLTFKQFREINGMDDERINYFVKRPNVLFKFIDFGYSLTWLATMEIDRIELLSNNHYGQLLIEGGIDSKQICSIELDRLTNFYKHEHTIDKVLQVISIQQLVGLNSRPLSLVGINLANQPVPRRSEGRGTMGDIQFSFTNYGCTFTHKNYQTGQDSSYTISFRPINEFYLDKAEALQREALAKGTLPLNLVHTWYLLIDQLENSKGYRETYCPETRYILKETFDETFPREQLAQFPYLSSIKYYNELNFINYLNKQGIPFKGFKNLSGMSPEKLEFLCDNLSSLEKFVNKGLKLEDCAKIAEKRLKLVMSNSDAALLALEFVTMDELFCIPLESPHVALSIFKDDPKEKTQSINPSSAKECKNTNDPGCSMM